jgi:hypothetical protein
MSSCAYMTLRDHVCGTESTNHGKPWSNVRDYYPLSVGIHTVVSRHVDDVEHRSRQ